MLNFIVRTISPYSEYPVSVSLSSEIHGRVDFGIEIDEEEGDLLLTPKMCWDAFQIRVHRLDVVYNDDPNYVYANGSIEEYLPFADTNVTANHVYECIKQALNDKGTNWDDRYVTFELMY